MKHLPNQLKKPLKAKYKNKSTEYDGYCFDSLAEQRRYLHLKSLQEEGTIDSLTVHPRYKLKARIPNKRQPNGREIYYEADFSYHDMRINETIVEDVKGIDTPVSKLKRAFVEYFYNIRVVIIKNGIMIN